jgi:predicted Zn-dependent protease
MKEETMLGQERCKQLADTILARSTADQTEVVIIAEDHALTRFANSMIHQNVAYAENEVRIRVVLGTRIGVATTNDLSDESVARTLDKALAIARLQPENPDFKSLPGPRPFAEVDAFAEATAICTPEKRARGAGAICTMAREAGVTGSGTLTTTVEELAVANSLGVSAYFPATRADATAVILGETGSGYAAAMAADINDLDFEVLGREAVTKCLRSENPRSLEHGEYTVVLEPYAVQDLVTMMKFTGLSSIALQEGRSFMAGKLGERLLDPRISIWDDGLDPAGMPMPFDFEGVPKQRVDFFTNGVAGDVVYDSYRAGKEEAKSSTGHALPAPNAFGPFPWNTFFAPGDATVEEMIASTERGIYVTRFWYTRPVEPARVVVTGMTRDGTFLIENGEIAYPIEKLRFTQGYLEALNNVEAIGKETRLLLGAADFARDSVPALKLSAFTFTGTTER